MRQIAAFLLMAMLASPVRTQQLSQADKKIVDMARARYYNLELAGFQSMSCSVVYDFSTLPPLFREDEANTQVLKATNSELKLDRNGAVVGYALPVGTPPRLKERATQPANLLKSLAQGVFQTWLSKGLNGPVPPFDSEIASVRSEDAGYLINLRVPGAPVEVHLDKDFLVKEIVSANGRNRERPTFKPSPVGLIFAGNEADDETQPGSPTHVNYEVAVSQIDGLTLPSGIHLRVNDNIDVKFALVNCEAKKGIVLKVSPP